MRVLHDRLTALVIALALLFASGPAHAQGYEAALAGFANVSFSDTETAINAVAASGNPLAERVIETLQDGRLLFDPADKKIYIRQPSGEFLNASTGRPVAGPAPAGLKTVRLNNRLRRAIDAAIGGLALLFADPRKGFGAAQAGCKTRAGSAPPNLHAPRSPETHPPRTSP